MRRVTLLWHGNHAIGIVVFSAPLKALAGRSLAFGLKSGSLEVGLAALNRQVWLLQRVVLHPSYRGTGLASLFVRRACRLCPVPWVETQSVLAQRHPLFERAGFRRVPTPRDRPAYFVLDNRPRVAGGDGFRSPPLPS